VAAPAGSKRVFTVADFTRFAPKTAYDMLVQVPGFTIRGADQERGLGQASENVLINGERIANKSGGAIGELQKISANSIDRIEIVEAASTGIAGLSGQVANVIVKAEKKSSGQFEWNPDVRAHFAKPNMFKGNASYTGEMGPVDYTLSVKNDAGRGAYGGPIVIANALGAVTETRDELYHGESDSLNLSTKFALDGPGSTVGNLTLAYTPYWSPTYIRDRRIRSDGDNRTRVTRFKADGWYYDVNADYEFALGPGRLKFIGVRHFEDEPRTTTQITEFDSGAAAEGLRLIRNSHIAETVARAEYGWKMGANDLQVTFERAFNSLDQKGALFDLLPDGEFVEVDFPGGTGKVVETRYEAIGTWSRPLSSTLDIQVAAGGERSTLERVDGDVGPRKFFRPKGSINLGWRPAAGWDASLKLRRRVGQISFYDFLDQPNLQQDRQNAGNPDLVPPQSWELESEIGRDFGAWGKTRLKTHYHRVEDIIDVIPLTGNGEGVGNLPRATRWGLESISTIQLDPMGLSGVKVNTTLGFERTRVKDPLTGETRPISGTRDYWASASMRHDIAGTKLAWGAYGEYNHYDKYFRLSEVFSSSEGPWWVGVYVEHKDVMGLTVRATVDNLLNARHLLYREIYAGRRNVTSIVETQDADQLIGPIFSLRVRGNF
jgi:outer membrane cobalamin receptor